MSPTARLGILATLQAQPGKEEQLAALIAGIGVALFYMIGAAIMTPDLWIEPLGALVKTGPAIVLMLVALATLDDR